MSLKEKIKGQGAQSNTHNHFQKLMYEPDEEDLTHQLKTTFTEVFPKSIVNDVKSPDLSMDYSLNPYQGCEHGCAYCFARPTHEFWGFSAGIDFERKIMIKQSAPELLEKFFQRKSYEPKPIVLSGNTDCYQPAERKLQITRKLLQKFLEYRHPVGIITKNALILRDIEILKHLREYNLISVTISFPTINEDLRKVMEPRTSTVANKLKAIETLAKNEIPVRVIAGPVIPGLNSEEAFPLFKAVSNAGAKHGQHILVRLNDTVEPVFREWLECYFPDRASKVLNHIKSLHGGNLGQKKFFERYAGEGNIAQMIHTTYNLAKKKYNLDQKLPTLSTDHFRTPNGIQLNLFP